jgi:pimeloyl-ACP methyl ester carboxylesterase
VALVAVTGPPDSLRSLVERFDAEVFEAGRSARIRLAGAGRTAWDVVIGDHPPRIEEADGRRPDAELVADERTWHQLAHDLRAGMRAFREGRLRVRRDLHLGVGFLAATSGAAEDGRLRFRHAAGLSIMDAGVGAPVVLLHGLGATKASFLPTVAALADAHRTIAVDLPGFGDSEKPLLAAYDPPFFADRVVRLLDDLGLERASFVGNSMGGRVALEVGLRHPARTDRLVLLAPSLAWLRDRPWAPLLRLVPPQLGVIQPAPRPVVEAIVRRVVPGSQEEWTSAGIDEFLRSYLQPAGRAAFYAAARNIYLEEPHGRDGFWERLPELRAPSLFVWGRRDPLVPISFQRHVREALPGAEHLELPGGHVPQLDAPGRVHAAMRRFLA